MNPFMLPEKDRLLSWRDLRNQIISAKDLDTQLVHLLLWWSKAPICRFSIDPFSCAEWPTPWELLNENMFCTSAVSYMMAQTLILSGIDSSRLRMPFIRGEDDERLVLILDDLIVLNYSYGETFSWEEIKKKNRILHEFRFKGSEVFEVNTSKA